MDESDRHNEKQRKWNTKEYTWYDSTYVKDKHRQNKSMMTEVKIEFTFVGGILIEKGHKGTFCGAEL